MPFHLNMRGAEVIMIVTAILGFGGSILTQWASHNKAVQASKDAIAAREQDRLDRQQKLEEMLAQSAMELDLLQARSAALKAEIARNAKLAVAREERLQETVTSQGEKIQQNLTATRETKQAVSETQQAVTETKQAVSATQKAVSATRQVASETREVVAEAVREASASNAKLGATIATEQTRERAMEQRTKRIEAIVDDVHKALVKRRR